MANAQSDLLTNLFQQAQQGKLSLITLIQKLPNNSLPNVPEMMFDQNDRYLKSQKPVLIPKKIAKQTKAHQVEKKISINAILQQKSISVLPLKSVEDRLSQLSIDEHYMLIANQFNLTSLDIEKQYELALKTRIEIPPILMRRILLDAIGIFHLMMQMIKDDDEKVRRLSKHLSELERQNQLYNTYC